jgi:hypothetical protein
MLTSNELQNAEDCSVIMNSRVIIIGQSAALDRAVFVLLLLLLIFDLTIFIALCISGALYFIHYFCLMDS